MTNLDDLDEDRFTLRIRQTLDSDSAQLSPAVADHLYRVRNTALARHGSDNPREPSFHGDVLTAILPRLRIVLMAVALTLGVLGTYYWQLFEEAQLHGEIDSELLADELPPNVHTDQGFRAWLQRASSESSPQ